MGIFEGQAFSSFAAAAANARENPVSYTHLDALLAYLTGIGYGDEQRAGEFEQRWPMQYHFVGKDITRFHCVIWPAMLMACLLYTSLHLAHPQGAQVGGPVAYPGHRHQLQGLG